MTFEYRYITSDCDAVATVYEYQKYAKSEEDAIADVLKAGVLVCLFEHMVSLTLLQQLHMNWMVSDIFSIHQVQILIVEHICFDILNLLLNKERSKRKI